MRTEQKTATAACRSCRRTVAWCLTANDKKMPVDVPAVPDGLFVVFPLGDDKYRALKFDARDPAHARRKRYTSHFATCPQADQHRRSR